MIQRFPLGKTGGLIEAARPAMMLWTWIPSFPLGKTGGLIEAGIGSAGGVSGGCFRWVKPAASLKQDDGEAIRHVKRWFPLGKTGGLIEAQGTERREAEAQAFPLGKTGGLIEAPERGEGVTAGKACFRWVKPAASLKLDQAGRSGDAQQVVSVG